MPKANIGCRTGGSCIASVFLYVDDIILLAPSAQVLQYLVNICEMELKFLDMTISASRSGACMRFGKVGRNASDRCCILKSKCLPI